MLSALFTLVNSSGFDMDGYARIGCRTTPQLVCVGSIGAEPTAIGIVPTCNGQGVSRALIEFLVYEEFHRAMREHRNRQNKP